MKKNKEFPYLILALLAVWCPLFMGAWNKAKPSSSTSLRNSNPEILANWDALETAFTQGHEFATGGTNSGKHEIITIEEETSAGASSTDEGHFQLIDGGSQPELAYTSEDGDELQFTKDGDLYSSDNLQVAGTGTFAGAITADGGIILGAGDDLIGSATSDITFNTNKFTVAGATGNTVVAGTLDVTGNIDPTTYETTNGGFLDEDNMASDSATAVSSQQAIKTFVDGKITGIQDPTYSGGQSHTFDGGLIFKHGTKAVPSLSVNSVTFANAFPTAVISGSCNVRSGSNITPAQLHALSTTIISLRNRQSSSQTIHWQAWGY